MLELVPITLKEANAFVERYHRHHKPVVGHKFSIAASDGEKIVGVAIVGRPVSRYLDNGLTLEVNRLCTDGTRNACSFLYSAAWRAARNLGYKKALLRGAGRDTESVRKLSVYGWRCSCNKGRHGRTAVCSSNTEAVRNAGEVGEADSDSKGIYRHAGKFRPPAHYRGRGRRLRRVFGSVQTVCRP